MADHDASDGDELVLAIPPDPEVISVGRLFLASVCRHLGMDEDQIDDVKIAVSEALTNAVKAHLGSDVVRPIRLAVRLGPQPAVEVSGAGPGFDADTQATLPDAVTPLAGLYEGSLGLMLIKSLFPDVEIERNQDRGMSVRFTLDLREAPEPAS